MELTKEESLLAEWSYSEKDWNEFVDIEKSNKKEDNLYFGIGILILGTFGLMVLRQTSFLGGLVFAVPIAVLIPWLRMKFSYPHLKKGISNPLVKIYSNYILINGKKIQLNGNQKRIKSITIIDTRKKKKLIEFNIQWLTRKGPTNDEFRILIPSDKIQEAKDLVQSF